MLLYNLKIIRGISLLVATTLILVCTLPAGGMIQYPIFQKGMSYVTWSKESFASPISDESLRTMADVGVDCVAIVPTWYQQKYNSIKIKPTDRTPSDSSLRHAIKKAHEYGMSVMLKPHVDLENNESCTRADIGFQTEDKWQRWFDKYVKFIAHYARLAEEEGVEFFCIGTELSFAATRTDLWKRSVIPVVRKAFSGQITYAANWDEYNTVEFWDELDYVGIDAYFPLSKKANPTLNEIKKGWEDWLVKIETFQAKIKKPVVFTECGYCSSDMAAMKPWEEAVSGPANTNIQADCYQALLETFWNKPWFMGIYWWNWNTSAASGGPTNRYFTPQNKSAMERIKKWYAMPVDDKLALIEKEQIGIKDVELEERLKLEGLKQERIYVEKEKGIRFSNDLATKNKKFEERIGRGRF